MLTGELDENWAFVIHKKDIDIDKIINLTRIIYKKIA